MADKIPITQKGFETLQERLKDLKFNKRPEVIQALDEARSKGDLSENAEYDAAREQQSFIEGLILELEYIISHAEVIDVTKITGSQIKFGAQVKLVEETEDEVDPVLYQIVGVHEADIKQGLLSISSPLARCLIGKKAQDVVEVNTPGGTKVYQILEVNYPTRI